jgi:hypothetical protein
MTLHRRKYLREYRKKRRKIDPIYRDRLKEITRKSRRKRNVQGMLTALKWRARKEGIPFALTESDIIVPLVCPVLGIPIIAHDISRRDHAPSVDKIKPELGYISGNVKVISFKANRLRSNASAEELRKVAEYAASIEKV